MHFMVLGYDGRDEKALERRMAVREAHLNLFRENIEKGIFIYGAGIQDDQDKLIGSMIICDFPSKEILQFEWLDKEPYVIGKVWHEIKISRALVPGFLLSS